MPGRWSHIKAFLTKTIDTLDSNIESFITATENAGSTKRGLDVNTINPVTTYVTDASTGSKMTVNSEGRGDVVQHAHPDNGMINFTSADLTASQDFILIDISDTTNYPHVGTSYAHIEWANVQVDSDNNGDYNLSIGYLENVDATDGDYREIWSITRSKQIGNNFSGHFPLYPNGPKCTNGFVATSIKSDNDTNFQTDVNLASTLDPTTADTPSGDGDLVLRVTRNAGTIKVLIQIGYHSH